MAAKAPKTQRVQAQYRLPKTLYRWVKDQSNREDVRPCKVVERALNAERTRLRSNQETEPDPEPAAAR